MNQDTDGNDVLADSPFAGDLDAELKAAPARRRLPGVALFLAAGVVAVGGFIGGVYVEKGTGDDTSGARPSGGQIPGGGQMAPGGQMPGGGGGAGGQGRQGMSSGTISKIKDGVVELTTQDGKTVEIKPGDTVLLRSRTQPGNDDGRQNGG
ncbi:hypothetical protein [Streptomyces sp. NPDC048606]|uniref:hypothetical protein n=1 Tax=Streptomyces sp. NPDC048606 TaxID=3154726 RepID=UPI00341B16B1